MTSGPLATVTLLGLPVELWREASAHQEAIRREFDIMRAGLPKESLPGRLIALMDEIDARFGAFSEPTSKELVAASERGDARVDLVYHMPSDAAAVVRRLGRMLIEVDEYCRTGDHLLTLATPSHQAAFRDWVFDEFTRQIESSLEPIAWDDYRPMPQEPPSNNQPGVTAGISHTVVFTGDLDLATAGTLREAIQEKRAGGLTELTLDLSDVGFMDSLGIGLLVATHNRLKEEGAKMRLIVPQRLYVLLELTGLIDLLHPEKAPE